MKQNIFMLLAVIICYILLPQNIFGQAPQKMSYQAVVRDTEDKLVKSSTVTMRISIIQGTIFGPAVYVETHSSPTNANGLVSLEIGSGTVVNGTFTGINWAGGPYFIKIETDPSGGTNYTISGTTQLLSVPYAIHSKTAETVSSVSLALDDLTDVSAATPSSGQVLGWNGTNWIPQTAGGGSTYSAGTGLDLVGTTFNAQVNTAIWNANKLQGNDIASVPATNGQVLTWNGTAWTPETPASGGGSNWTLSNGNVYRNSGRVGINNTAPVYPLHINWSGQSGPNNETRALYVNVVPQNTTGSWMNSGIYSNMTTGTAAGRAIEGYASGANFGTGVYGESITQTSAYGTMGVARSSSTDNSEKRGIFGWALGSATGGGTGIGGHFGVYGIADGVGDDVTGVQGISNGSTGNRNYGVYGHSNGSGGINSGITGIGNASGGTGLNIGVLGATLSAPVGATNYAGYFLGDVTVTGTFSNPSDRMFKTNIEPMESALELISQIKPVSYFHTPEMIQKMNLSSAYQMGFIAQDMELIFPHLVKKEKFISKQYMISGQNGISGNEAELIEFKSINYLGLIPILTKALQEQQEIIKALEERLKVLESK